MKIEEFGQLEGMNDTIEVLLSSIQRLEEKIKDLENVLLCKSQHQQKDTMMVPDVAAFTGYTANYIRVLASKREIPHYKKGHRLMFSKKEIERWVFENKRLTNQEINKQASSL